MTFATLLDGYALNTSIRFTFSEPEPVVGGASSSGDEPTRIVFASGVAESSATSAGTPSRTAYMSPSACVAAARAPAANAWRVMGVTVFGVASGADSTAICTRLAYLTPTRIAGGAESKPFEPLRLAQPITEAQVKDHTLNGFMLGDSGWHNGRSDGFADSTISSQTLATRLIEPVLVPLSGTASITPLAYDLTRWMKPKQARNRAISYVKEGLIFKLLVNQQYATGTSIARAFSRGTPNTILAFSITYGEAGMSLAQSAVKIARDAVPGRAVAEAGASGVTHQDHAIRGRAVGVATAHISPDVIHAVRHSYVRGRMESTAASSGRSTWVPTASGVTEATARLSVAPTITRNGATGREVYLSGKAAATALSAAVTSQTHYAGGHLAPVASSAISFTVIRTLGSLRHAYAWGIASGVSSVSTATGVRWPMVRGIRQPAWASLDVTQLIARDMYGDAKAEGASVSNPLEAIVTHTVWMKGVANAAANTSIDYTALRKADGVAVAESESIGVPWHWIAVAADGVAQAKADAFGENPRVYAYVEGGLEARCEVVATGYKVAYVSGRANAGGATLGDFANVTRRMKPVAVTGSAEAKRFYPKHTHATSPNRIEARAAIAIEARNARVKAIPAKADAVGGVVLPWAEQAGEIGARHFKSVYGPALFDANSTVSLPWAEKAGEIGARRLRWILLDDVGAAVGMGGASKNVFKINAGNPAPVRRTINIPYTDTRLVIARTPREYRIR